MDPTPARRPGLWAEIALALALITLATILLNAGVFWLLVKTTEAGRRSDLCQAMSRAAVTQLESGAATGRLSAEDARRVLGAYADRGLDIEEMWVVGLDLAPLWAPAQAPPQVADAGLREALYGRSMHTELQGALWGERSVVVTTPIAPQGRVVGALRVRMPMKGTPLPGGPAAFVFGYTLFSGVAIALFGFSLFRNRLINPVARIQGATDRIASGDFGHTVRVDAAAELQALCGALNTLSLSLSGYRQRTAEQLDRLAAANRHLEEAQQALVRSEKLAGVGRMAAGLAHEVGNPLAAVLGYMELMQQDLDDPELERDLVDRSRRELERIHRIIQQLLGYARPSSLPVEAVDVGAAAKEAVETLRHQPLLREVKLSWSLPEEPLCARIEADRLHQVMLNLLLNAGGALRGRKDGEIRIEVRLEGPLLRLDLLDNGHGFDPVALDRAFEPFFTTNEVGEGTGLGLPTCAEILASVGGRIEAANRPEGGACLSLWLPRVEPEPADG